MKRGLHIALTALIWAAIILYLLWAGNLGHRKREEATVKELRVVVRDSSDIKIVRSKDIAGMLISAGHNPVGKHIDSVDLKSMADIVSARNFVNNAKASVDLEGIVTVSLNQREPILRVITENGYDFYYTDDDYIVPTGRHSAHYVPVVTGNFNLPFARSFSGNLEQYITETEKKSDKSYVFLCKLITFVKYVEDNDFWNSQIVQINVLPSYATGSMNFYEPNIELIPRVGDHVVLFGNMDDYKHKLDKLLSFYKKALSREGWDKWNYIDIRYDNQVVCSNR